MFKIKRVALASIFLFEGTFAFTSPPIPFEIPTSFEFKLQSSLASLHHEEMLSEMTKFFGDDMVDPESRRFYYYCYPFDGECRHVHFPMRDLAATWDAAKALEFSYSSTSTSCNDNDNDNVLKAHQQLQDAIKCSILFYSQSISSVNQENGLSLNRDILLEVPNIGHSALMLLGSCSAIRLGIVEESKMIVVLNGLAKGILSKQLANGAFSTEFGDNENYLGGIEFFPGEAMLSLIQAYQLSMTRNILEESTQQAILPAMEKAFEFYSNYYNDVDVDTNYNIWQALAFSNLYDSLNQNSIRKQQVAKYVLDLCQEICQSRSWKYQLARGQSFYINIETIEIACGLDALAEGIRLAQAEKVEDLVRLFRMHATNAVYFLKWSQEQVPSSAPVGRGGLGYGGVQVFEQRLDVTGHAISALTKLMNLSQ